MWKCSNCLAINEGDTCINCGSSKDDVEFKKDKVNGKHIMIILSIGFLLVASLFVFIKWDYLSPRPSLLKENDIVYRKISSYNNFDLYTFDEEFNQNRVRVCQDMTVIISYDKYDSQVRYVDLSCYPNTLIKINDELIRADQAVRLGKITIDELIELQYPMAKEENLIIELTVGEEQKVYTREWRTTVVYNKYGKGKHFYIE